MNVVVYIVRKMKMLNQVLQKRGTRLTYRNGQFIISLRQPNGMVRTLAKNADLNKAVLEAMK